MAEICMLISCPEKSPVRDAALHTQHHSRHPSLQSALLTTKHKLTTQCGKEQRLITDLQGGENLIIFPKDHYVPFLCMENKYIFHMTHL